MIMVWLIHVSVSRKTYPGFRHWTAASVCTFAGYTLAVFRGFLPDFLTIVAPNIAIIFSMVLLEAGLLCFCGKRPAYLGYAWRLLPFASGFLWFTYAVPSMPARVCTLSTGLFLFSLRCAWVVSRKVPQVLPEGNGLLTFAFAALGLLNALRLAATLSEANPKVGITLVGGWHNVVLLGSTTGTVLLYTGFVTIQAQKLELDLIAARDAIKTLEGLLPVCASCKKVRDTEGAWNPFEYHIARHSEARVSHGLCPDCAKVYFPDDTEDDQEG